jgi:ATP-dependent Lon protease
VQRGLFKYNNNITVHCQSNLSKKAVFVLDEIDKPTNLYTGDPANVLFKILDPGQNHNFSDHYPEEPYDLSDLLFIATIN